MANGQETQVGAKSDDDETVFAARFIRILHFQPLLVVEDGRSLFERDAMLGEILTGLLGIPGEWKIGHADIVATLRLRAKCLRVRRTEVDPVV